MSARVLIEVGIGETRGALVEDGRLIALAIERDAAFDPGADIFLGRVGAFHSRMKAHEIALPDDVMALLPASDGKRLAEGQAAIVQIDRAAHGRKGPRVTTDIAIAGRYVAFNPGKAGVGLARGTPSAAGLTKRWAHLAKGGGLRLRPSIDQAEPAWIESEAARLDADWRDIEARARETKAPACLAADLQPVRRLLRDAPARCPILIDDAGEAATLGKALATLAPDLAAGLSVHRERTAIFALEEVDAQIAQALEARIELANGVALSIEPTEALTAIDVDVGGAEDLEAACRSAAAEIARQIRLRRIGGQIVVDFPRLSKEAQRRKLAEHLRDRLARDPEPVEFGGLTRLGLVEFARRRAGPTLGELLGTPRAGFVPSAATEARAVLRRALAEARARPGHAVVAATPAGAKRRLDGEDGALLDDFRRRTGVALDLKADRDG
jgi:Rne/Rng family ribonuclease